MADYETGVEYATTPGSDGSAVDSTARSAAAAAQSTANGAVSVNSTQTSDIAANTAAIALKADKSLTIRAHTGTTDTLVLADAGKLITSNNAAAVTQTINSNTNVPYPVGTVIQHLQLGAGQVSWAITADTLRVPTGFVAKTRGQYCTVTATKIAATEWVLSGDLAFV